jgi:WD repeat and FYVE domain-containing protein 3
VATKPLDCQNNNRRAIQLNLTPPAPDPVIVHAGVVIAMLQLLPSIYNPSAPKVLYLKYNNLVNDHLKYFHLFI